MLESDENQTTVQSSAKEILRTKIEDKKEASKQP